MRLRLENKVSFENIDSPMLLVALTDQTPQAFKLLMFIFIFIFIFKIKFTLI